MSSGTVKRSASTSMSLPSSPFSLQSTSSTVTSVCPRSRNRFRKISSSRCPTTQTRCNAPRCAPSEVMPVLAMSFPTRNRPRANDTSFYSAAFHFVPVDQLKDRGYGSTSRCSTKSSLWPRGARRAAVSRNRRHSDPRNLGDAPHSAGRWLPFQMEIVPG